MQSYTETPAQEHTFCNDLFYKMWKMLEFQASAASPNGVLTTAEIVTCKLHLLLTIFLLLSNINISSEIMKSQLHCVQCVTHTAERVGKTSLQKSLGA